MPVTLADRLAATSLTAAERRTLERLVPSLEAELADDLRAVWLFGSRARGEAGHPDSDVDLLVVTNGGRRRDGDRVTELIVAAAEAEGESLFIVEPYVVSATSVAEQRAIGWFLFAEIDRDRVVLGGEDPLLADLPHVDIDVEREDGMKTRTESHLRKAEKSLRGARYLLEAEVEEPALSMAYDSARQAAGAALSEADRYTRTHRGLWHLFHATYVATGRFPPDLHAAASSLAKPRHEAEYGKYPTPDDSELPTVTLDEARRAVATAERFLAAVHELIR